jgi:hypothetical protein
MFVATLFVGGIVRLLGHRASSVMVSLAIVFAVTFPFLFAWRPADGPDYSDALLGWPLIYAYAQSDSGLASFRLVPLFADFAVGAVIGILYILFRRRNAVKPNS